MKIEILNEAGFNEAIYGLSLSYNTTLTRAYERSLLLYNKNEGHNKFLEHIDIWMKVTAPRFWWSEADTIRLSTKQSESTMHTIQNGHLTQSDFEYDIPLEYLRHLNSLIDQVRNHSIDIDILKNDLPEGFLQTREWKISYNILRNIIVQRRNHKLPQWRSFCDFMLKNIEHEEYMKDLIGE